MGFVLTKLAFPIQWLLHLPHNQRSMKKGKQYDIQSLNLAGANRTILH